MRAKATPPAATHLAASMRVVASHLHIRRVTIDTEVAPEICTPR